MDAKREKGLDVFQKGVRLFKLNKVFRALICLQKAAEAHPGDYKRQFFFGVALYRNEQYEDAVPYLARAVALDSKQFLAHYYLSLSLEGASNLANPFEQGELIKRALVHSREALRLAQSLPDLSDREGVLRNLDCWRMNLQKEFGWIEGQAGSDYLPERDHPDFSSDDDFFPGLAC